MTQSLLLSREQMDLIQASLNRKTFLTGPAGTGKTAAGVGRLLHLLDAGISAERILVVVPQRTLASPYYEALRRPGRAAGGAVNVATVGGLARRMIDLFWPLVVEEEPQLMIMMNHYMPTRIYKMPLILPESMSLILQGKIVHINIEDKDSTN